MALERDTRPAPPAPTTTGSPAPDPQPLRRSGMRWTARYVGVLCALDLLAGLAAGALARLVLAAELPTHVTGSGWLRYTQLAVAVAPTWVAAVAAAGAYRTGHVPPPGQDIARLLRAGVTMLAALALSGLVWRLEISRGFVAVTLVLLVTLSVFARVVTRLALRALRRRGRCAERVLLIGRADSTRPLAAHLGRDRSRVYEVVGSVTAPGGTGDRPGTPSHEEAVAHVLTAVAAHQATTVVIGGTEAFGPGGARQLVGLLAEAGIDVLIAPEIDEFGGPRVRVRPVADLLLLEAGGSDPGMTSTAGKWLFDRVLAALLLVLGAPLLLALALAVRLDSPGPALFRQKRTGRGGAPFTMMKFRTMVADAEDRLHRDGLYDLYVENGFKLPAEIDPRVTRLGRFLRRTSLDELPQLINVVKGEMSLVGPRPVERAQLAQYGELAPAYLAVRPGLTGYWQVNGRSDVGFPERAELDAYYVNNRSLRLDLLILSRTVLAVLRREGAH